MYNEIFKLKELLEKGNIPFEFKNFHDGYQIIIKNKNNFRIADAIENEYSHGNEEDLLEIMGGVTEEEEEAFGGLARIYGRDSVLKTLDFKSNEEEALITKVKSYIINANNKN